MVSLRARPWLHRQNRLLRATVIRRTRCGLVVGPHWISMEFQPAGPSGLDVVASSSPLHALHLARIRWSLVRARVPGPHLLGVVWL